MSEYYANYFLLKQIVILQEKCPHFAMEMLAYEKKVKMPIHPSIHFINRFISTRQT